MFWPFRRKPAGVVLPVVTPPLPRSPSPGPAPPPGGVLEFSPHEAPEAWADPADAAAFDRQQADQVTAR